ncbi:MAG: UbiD family decarboxylase [Bacteroidetes bacterium]|nr:UbiD family decarboxylase [Bacteroidota bacterium]
MAEGISLAIIAVKKSRKQHIRHLAADLLKKALLVNVKFVLFVDNLQDLDSLSQIVWLSANNIDPLRDCFFIEAETGIKYPTLCIDATRKNREFDDFQRDWPNVIVLDEKTIVSVDEKWPNLKLGPLVLSPSIGYKSLVVSIGAVSIEDF